MTGAPPPQAGARVGKACPPFAFTSVQGDAINSKDILARKALAVLFSDGPLPPALAQRCDELARRYPDDCTLVLITAGPAADAALPYPVATDHDGTLARTFGRQEPFEGYFVRRDGLVTRHARGDDPLLTDPDAFQRLIVAMIG